MATVFPGAIDDFVDYVDGTTIMEAANLNNMEGAIEALQAKVGVDGSAVTTSHDYKISRIADGDLPVTTDSDAQPMAKAHAYKAQTAGFVTAYVLGAGTNALKGYVGATDDPEGAGTLMGETIGSSAMKPFVSFFVAKDKYFELTHSSEIVVLTWTPLAIGGGNPIDQD